MVESSRGWVPRRPKPADREWQLRASNFAPNHRPSPPVPAEIANFALCSPTPFIPIQYAAQSSGAAVQRAWWSALRAATSLCDKSLLQQPSASSQSSATPEPWCRLLSVVCWRPRAMTSLSGCQAVGLSGYQTTKLPTKLPAKPLARSQTATACLMLTICVATNPQRRLPITPYYPSAIPTGAASDRPPS
jgi:hypothetical protein